jgi:hypothetical protein
LGSFVLNNHSYSEFRANELANSLVPFLAFLPFFLFLPSHGSLSAARSMEASSRVCNLRRNSRNSRILRLNFATGFCPLKACKSQKCRILRDLSAVG